MMQLIYLGNFGKLQFVRRWKLFDEITPLDLDLQMDPCLLFPSQESGYLPQQLPVLLLSAEIDLLQGLASQSSLSRGFPGFPVSLPSPGCYASPTGHHQVRLPPQPPLLQVLLFK